MFKHNNNLFKRISNLFKGIINWFKKINNLFTQTSNLCKRINNLFKRFSNLFKRINLFKRNSDLFKRINDLFKRTGNLFKRTINGYLIPVNLFQNDLFLKEYLEAQNACIASSHKIKLINSSIVLFPYIEDVNVIVFCRLLEQKNKNLEIMQLHTSGHIVPHFLFPF